jgi:hypothetical protein
MKEYPKDEVIRFFKSVVNPALEDCAAGLKERGWQRRDLQIGNPEDLSHWFDDTFSASINASKDGKVREFCYAIFATPAPSSNGYNVLYKIAQHGPGASGGQGGHHEGDYRRNINSVTKEDFLKDVKTQYYFIKPGV